MAKKPDYQKVTRVVKRFARRVSAKLPLEKVILFGSYARGTAGPDSDIDLVFISKKFRGLDSFKRLEILGLARDNYEFSFDYFGLTPEEYENASPLTTLGEIKETGKEIDF